MTIAILAEYQGSTALELVGKARSIAPDAHIAVLCEDGNAGDFASAGADEQVVLPFLEDDCAQAERIADALRPLAPDAALFPELAITEDGLLKQIRPAFGGNLTAEILCRSHRPQLASVRPGVFPMPEGQAEKPIRKKRSCLRMESTT